MSGWQPTMSGQTFLGLKHLPIEPHALFAIKKNSTSSVYPIDKKNKIGYTLLYIAPLAQW